MLTIRRADVHDAADMASILALTQEYASMPSSNGEPLSDATIAQLSARLREHPGIVALLALSESGKAVGLAMCVLSWSSFKAGTLINIHDLVVSETARNQGIGAQLLAAVDDEAKRLGAVGVTLEVAEDNPAERLYLRAGFAHAGRFMKKLF